MVRITQNKVLQKTLIVEPKCKTIITFITIWRKTKAEKTHALYLAKSPVWLLGEVMYDISAM